MNKRKASERIIEAILMDLTDRRGLRQAWESIDADIQEEIKVRWEEIVLEVLQP